jgi:O-antigen/teichoic acid export membrane protein
LVLVYGRPEFATAAPAFSLYTGLVVVYMASMVTFSVYLAIARPELQRRFTIVRAVLVVITLYPLSVMLGGTGAALALLVSMIGAMAVQLLNLRQVTGLRVLAYLSTMRAGLLLATVTSLPLLAVVVFLHLPAWGDMAVGGALGAVAWGAAITREGYDIKRLRAARTSG